jgi:hypothetical protein
MITRSIAVALARDESVTPADQLVDGVLTPSTSARNEFELRASDGQELVLISSSAKSCRWDRDPRRRATDRVENGAFSTMVLAATRLGVDFASTFNQTTVDIAADAPSLAAGLTGDVTITRRFPNSAGRCRPRAR